MPAITILERLRQEDCHEFEASSSCIEDPTKQGGMGIFTHCLFLMSITETMDRWTDEIFSIFQSSSCLRSEKHRDLGKEVCPLGLGL